MVGNFSEVLHNLRKEDSKEKSNGIPQDSLKKKKKSFEIGSIEDPTVILSNHSYRNGPTKIRKERNETKKKIPCVGEEDK